MLTDVPGVAVGHLTDAEAGTGCTVVLPPRGTVGAVDVRGGGPSARETDLLSPFASVPDVTALLLTGGSAFGLSAAAGVERWCEERGLGHETGPARVPIVPAAVIFDLGITGNARRPGPDDAYAACAAAGTGPHPVGSVGAGTGATVGKLLGAGRLVQGRARRGSACACATGRRWPPWPWSTPSATCSTSGARCWPGPGRRAGASCARPGTR